MTPMMFAIARYRARGTVREPVWILLPSVPQAPERVEQVLWDSVNVVTVLSGDVCE
jgi:hypothetical protein